MSSMKGARKEIVNKVPLDNLQKEDKGRRKKQGQPTTNKGLFIFKEKKMQNVLKQIMYFDETFCENSRRPVCFIKIYVD